MRLGVGESQKVASRWLWIMSKLWNCCVLYHRVQSFLNKRSNLGVVQKIIRILRGTMKGGGSGRGDEV